MEPETGRQDANPDVWIIGHTVLMDGIEASLRELTLTDLTRWDTIDGDLAKQLKTHHPDLIIFQLDTPGSNILLDLLKEKPGIHLLGIDPECNQVLVINSIQKQTQTMSDLYQIVSDVSALVN